MAIPIPHSPPSFSEASPDYSEHAVPSLSASGAVSSRRVAPPPVVAADYALDRKDPTLFQISPGYVEETNDAARDLTINSGGEPFVLNVYKASLTSNDELVKAGDKETVLYHLNRSKSLFSAYSLTLFSAEAMAKSSDPIPLATITKGSYGFSSNDVKIVMPSGWSCAMYSTGIMKKSREFVGMSSVGRFDWATEEGSGKGLGGKGERLICTESSTGREIAVWRRTNFAVKKSGTLTINKSYEKEIELILATALGVEEWRRTQAASYRPGIVE